MNPSMIGWSHIPFGRLDDSLEEMIIKVARGAIADAGVDAGEVDAMWLGHFNSAEPARQGGIGQHRLLVVSRRGRPDTGGASFRLPNWPM